MLKAIRRLFSRKKKYTFELTLLQGTHYMGGFHIYWKEVDVEAIWRPNYFSFFSHRSNLSGELLAGYHDFARNDPEKALEYVGHIDSNEAQRARWAYLLSQRDPSVNWAALFEDMGRTIVRFRWMNLQNTDRKEGGGPIIEGEKRWR